MKIIKGTSIILAKLEEIFAKLFKRLMALESEKFDISHSVKSKEQEVKTDRIFSIKKITKNRSISRLQN